MKHFCGILVKSMYILCCTIAKPAHTGCDMGKYNTRNTQMIWIQKLSFFQRPWQECVMLLIGGDLRSRRGCSRRWVQIVRIKMIIGTLYTTSTSTLYNANWRYGEGRPDTTHWMPHVGPMTSSWNGRQVKHPHNADCWITHHPHRPRWLTYD